MRSKISLIVVVLALLALPSCDKNKGKDNHTPEKPDSGQTTDPDPGPSEPTGPTAAQLQTVADFVSLAVAGDDYCASLANAGGKFTVTTFSGKSCSIDAEIPIVAEGASTTGLKDYVLDGNRFAEFHLGGETVSLPSDIHSWYNPPLPRGCEHLNVLFTGNAFCDDATILLPGMVAATGSAAVDLGRALKEGAALADWNTNFSTASWCSYGLWTPADTDWPIVISANSSFEDALKARAWDVVTIMEDSTLEAGWTYTSAAGQAIDALLGKIFNCCKPKRPTVLLMLAPALPSTHETVVSRFEGSSDKMFEALTAYGKAVTENTGIFDVVSICAAQQNLRTSTLMYASANGLTRDGVRLDCGVGCFTAAGTVFCKILEPCMGFSFDQNSYVYDQASAEEGQIATAVTPANLPLCRYAASNAASFPLKLTDLSSLSPDVNGSAIPDVGRDNYPDTL